MENIRIENLKFRYKTADSNALENISFSLEKGDFLVICGQSGSGKTTLLRLLKPELMPNGYLKGDIFYNGVRLLDVPALDSVKIGYVFQNPDNQIVTDKVYHELAFGLESLGLASDEIKIRLAEIVEFFNLTAIYNKNTSELSGGEKQLVNLASIVAMKPEVLIFDEPTSQLDPITATEFLRTIKRLNDELGITIILTEHRLEEVFNLASKIAILDKGNLAIFDTPENICKSKNLTEQMQFMLPTTLRLYSTINAGGTVPLNIAQCKNYLLENVNIKYDSIEKPQQNISDVVAVEIKKGYFRYEKNSLDILKDVNLKVYKGEIFSIVGGNGVGKSTMLKCIAGIKNLYSGKIKYFGNSLKNYRKDKKFGTISMLSQNPTTLFVKDSVIKDLQEVEKLAGYSKQEFEKMLTKVIELVDIKSVLNSHPFDLSGGEMQKVALAKVLLLQPQILLLDEVTKGLDNYYKKKLGDILIKLIEQGVTIIQVTHDIEFASKYSSRVGMMFNGEIIAVNDRTKFFINNSYYTTQSVKISKDIYKNTVNVDELIELTKKNMQNA